MRSSPVLTSSRRSSRMRQATGCAAIFIRTAEGRPSLRPASPILRLAQDHLEPRREMTRLALRQMPDVLLDVQNLVVRFPVFGGIFLRRVGEVEAVKGISFQLHRGE